MKLRSPLEDEAVWCLLGISGSCLTMQCSLGMWKNTFHCNEHWRFIQEAFIWSGILGQFLWGTLPLWHETAQNECILRMTTWILVPNFLQPRNRGPSRFGRRGMRCFDCFVSFEKVSKTCFFGDMSLAVLWGSSRLFSNCCCRYMFVPKKNFTTTCKYFFVASFCWTHQKSGWMPASPPLATWMSQEVSKRFESVDYHPNISRL